MSEKIPLRWPVSWGAPRYRKLGLGGINTLIVDQPAPDLVEAYARDGISVVTLRDAGVAPLPESKWPQVQTSSGGGDADAGPTGVPWVDANGYLVQVARALHPGQPVWLDYGPPEGGARPTPDAVKLAICDAAAYGGHWILRGDLADEEAAGGTLEFFARHREWQDYRALGRLAVVSSFLGASREPAVETLNLLSRRLIPYVILPEGQVQTADLSSYRAILRVDQQPAAGAVAAKLEAFAKRGGLLIRPASKDPYQTAVETHLQMSRRNDVLRLWNAGSFNVDYSGSPDGREDLVQLLNYSARKPSAGVTLGLAKRYRRAQLYTLDAAEPMELRIMTVRAGIEVPLPPFPVYGALRLEA